MQLTAKKQILLMMKFTALFLITACLTVSARTTAQTVSLNEKRSSLEKVLQTIKKQSGYTLFYDYDLVKSKGKPVDIDVKNVPVAEVLQKVFIGQVLTYEINGNTILVKEKEIPKDPLTEGLNNRLEVPAPPPTVHGRITNEKGEAVAGVNISIKGGKVIGVTNDNGEFTLTNVPDGATLVFSAVNIVTYETKLNGRSELELSMKTKVSELDEVQIIAYGQTTKRLNAGNTSTVKAEDIEKQPVNNPLLALQGRVPGLFITQSTGLPGTGVTVRIQGQNSLGKGNDPLYVIDGVPYSSQMLPTINQTLGSSGSAGLGYSAAGNPLNFINPADILSIDILKDADATAIYGSRGGNGVILITTKKGKSGKTETDINIQNGWGQVSHFLPLLNLKQYLQMRHEALSNDGLNPNPSIVTSPTDANYDINGHWDSTRYTDWQKVLIGGTAHYTDMQASISGGNANTQFLVGGGYHRETTVFPGDLADMKGSMHFNINNTSTNQKFHLQLTGSYMADNNQLIPVDLTTYAIKIAPDAPALYNTDGTLNWAPLASGNSSTRNPLAYLYQSYINKTNNLIGNALLSYKILSTLEFKTSLGYNNLESNETQIYPVKGNAPETRPTGKGTSFFGTSQSSSWIVEPYLTYKKNISRGRLEILTGTTFQQAISYRQQFTGSGYATDAQLSDIRSAATISVGNTLNAIYNYNAAFGKINYNWQDKYIVNVSARRDGSSRFGPENKFHNFGSIAGAWIFSNENFSKTKLPELSFGKLRASYGTTGNDQIGDYAFLNLYNNVTAPVPYQGANGLTPAGIYNPFLQWEETRKLQFGLDLGFFNDRVLFSTNYAHNRSSNQLLSFALPVITGFQNISPFNFPATIQNTSWEFSLKVDVTKGRDFNWTVSSNLTLPKNKLVSFPGIEQTAYASSLIVGEPFTISKTFHFLGVDPVSGIFQFANWDGGITQRPDTAYAKNQISAINLSPKFYGGFQNSFSYKGFSLDMSFQFCKQVGPNYSFGNTPGRFFGTSLTGNQPAYILDHWQNPGDLATFQKYSSTYPINVSLPYSNTSASDAGYSDASYVRLKNVSVSWKIPAKWKQAAHFQNARIYIQGQNLFTITSYKGLDPETRSSVTLPPLRVITIGVQVTL